MWTLTLTLCHLLFIGPLLCTGWTSLEPSTIEQITSGTTDQTTTESFTETGWISDAPSTIKPSTASTTDQTITASFTETGWTSNELSTIESSRATTEAIEQTTTVLVSETGWTSSDPNTNESSRATTEAIEQTTPGLVSETDSSYTCGGFLKLFSGVIYSPSYPNYYPAHSHCIWSIQTTESFRIELRFQHFDLEPHPSCAYDWVTIYDGTAGHSPQLGKICQNGFYSFHSSSNIIGVEFRSDSTIHHTGFLAEFSSFYEDNWTGYTTVTDHWVTGDSIPICGGVLTNPTGAFNSPVFPGLYPDYSLCTWEIRVLPDQIVKLNFMHFDLEIGNQCNYDSVTIYDGLPLSSPQLGKFCSPVTTTITSTSNIMGVLFRSDGSVRKTGFQAVYTSSPRKNGAPVNCGGILTYPWGVLDSPFYPNSQRLADCVWHIQAPNDQRVQMYFSDFALENSPLCNSGFVSVYDGTPLGSPLLGTYCGSVNPHFTSSSNSLSVVYSSRGSTSSSVRGFSAYYYFVSQNQNLTLSCYSDHMEINISTLYLGSLSYSPNDVFLNDPQCRPQRYGNWLQFTFQFNQCGTMKQGEADAISYSNSLHAYHSSQIIQRTKKLNFNLRCQMYQNTMVDIMYNADDTIYKNVIQQGLYSASLSFYNSRSFQYPVYQFPFFVQLNQNLYLQATLHSSDPDLILFVDTCVASPDQNDFVTNTYYLIYKGCIKDPSYSTYPSPNIGQARFGFSAFGFANRFSTVYLQCKLKVCQRYDYSSRCNHGCVSRRKRDTISNKNEVTVLLGPVKLQ